jgi:hypothetical protein
MEGKITRISITWTTANDKGRSYRFYGLFPDAGKIIRPDRMHELLDDLTVMCEQIQAVRDGKLNGAGSTRAHELPRIK